LNMARKIFTGLISLMLALSLTLTPVMAAEVDRYSQLVEDPVVLEMVNRVTQNLVINSDIKVPVTVKVINASEINAFALPGGFLYVNRGLIEAADSARSDHFLRKTPGQGEEETRDAGESFPHAPYDQGQDREGAGVDRPLPGAQRVPDQQLRVHRRERPREHRRPPAASDSRERRAASTDSQTAQTCKRSAGGRAREERKADAKTTAGGFIISARIATAEERGGTG
jgi:hypothetical protein